MTKDLEKRKAFDALNERMGRELPRTVIPKADNIIIGVVINLPDAKKYNEKDFIDHNGMIQPYNKDQSKKHPNEFAKLYPYGLGYGKVLAVGSEIHSDVKVGDCIILRGMPTDSFIYKGCFFHHIREVEIAAIIKDDTLELYNK